MSICTCKVFNRLALALRDEHYLQTSLYSIELIKILPSSLGPTKLARPYPNHVGPGELGKSRFTKRFLDESSLAQKEAKI